MAKEIFIRDPQHKSELRIYNLQGYVYIQKNALPTTSSESVHVLDKVKVMTISEDEAFRLTLEYFNKKYPHYNDFINLRSYE